MGVSFPSSPAAGVTLQTLKTVTQFHASKGQYHATLNFPGGWRVIYYSANHYDITNYLNIIKHHSQANSHQADFLLLDICGLQSWDRRFIYAENIRKVVDTCHQYGLSDKCILKEITPQHFTDIQTRIFYDGEYKGTVSLCPADKIQTYYAKARFRNDIVWQNRGNLTVLPVFDALMSRSQDHIKPQDCTHFKENTAVWESIHINFMMLLSGQKVYSSFEEKCD
jgi:hypothetical protein